MDIREPIITSAEVLERRYRMGYTDGYKVGATEQKAIDKKLIYAIIEETVGFVRRQYPDAEDSDYADVVYKTKGHIEAVYKEMREEQI